MGGAAPLERGREAFAGQRWAEAFEALSVADRAAALPTEDLSRLAAAAYLVGRGEDSATLYERAIREYVAGGEVERAARCGYWLIFTLINRGEWARASGWLGRARRLIDDGQRECAEQGYLLLPSAVRCMFDGDAAAAYAGFGQAAKIGDRYGEVDLVTLARLGSGHSLIMLGEVAAGVALLDEAMVAVVSGEVSPMVAGLVYCGVIDACQTIFDLRRAREWTEALTDWCRAQPELVQYRGQCLVHRVEILRMRGAWDQADEAAQLAYERFLRPPGDPAVGRVCAEIAEGHRLTGDLARAEEAYRRASEWGAQVQPGLALVRLAQGDRAAATAAVRRALDETADTLARPPLLRGYVEIMLGVDDQAAARAGADELAVIAADLDAPLLRAAAGYADGAVRLAGGDARGALPALRRAWDIWRELGSPYEAARTRVLIGRACRELGDEDSACLELDAARTVLARLGAAGDLAALDPAPAPAGPLTSREIEVMRLVAAGKSNRAIAAELVLSEKTVARHVSNILTKLGLPSRTAATAYAYQHDLL